MRKAFPAIRPYKTHHIAVTEPHLLYVEESGNPEGIPVLFVHGGPGGGAKATDRCFFDPDKYRIVLFDQRGAGQSTPHACLEDNHTAALIEDIETIRKRLQIDRWVIFGGSWGSTLGLVYAETYPELVLGLILRGIFLCRDEDIHWFYQQGASHVFPDYWQQYVQVIPESERGDMLSAYYSRLTGENEIERMAAAKAWSTWEGRCATLHSNEALVDQFANPHVAMAMARIEAHFFINQAFLEPDQITKNAHRLKDIPGTIVHGRYDMVCPVNQAFSLSEAWPQARLKIIADAGHSSGEPGITDALIVATESLAHQLNSGADH
ncbi:MAG: prolyl aminopeptidase [Porticoccaceae bacterium]|jgi:proline iminopeptidase|nr:prolyl aminopeptidase [Porticoccaceae bacterium]MBT5577519.1 prolyl aminopeptidase [Porticoccaceae bacterium]MBT7375082.1 prolyl aminopeptidase [Porticoccaceae bacterium]